MKLSRTHVIALANQKGGCGKTTASVNIAAGLALAGYTVTLIDNDQQCNATDSFGLDRDELAKQGRFTVADIYLGKRPVSEIQIELGDRFKGNLAMVIGHRGLGAVQPKLEAELHARVMGDQNSDLDADDLRNEHRTRLKNSISSVVGKRDFVIIDTPPELGFCMTTALIAADHYVIPVFPGGYELKGLEALTRTVEKVKRFNPRIRLLGVVLGNYDGRAKLDRDIQKMLVSMFGEDVPFRTVLSRSVKHREATVYGVTIFEHAGTETAAQQLEAIVRELVERVGGPPATPPTRAVIEPAAAPEETPADTVPEAVHG